MTDEQREALGDINENMLRYVMKQVELEQAHDALKKNIKRGASLRLTQQEMAGATVIPLDNDSKINLSRQRISQIVREDLS